MKRSVLILTVIALGWRAPAIHAQGHSQLGIFADYFRLQQTKSNFAGVGDRVSINTSPAVQHETELDDDFQKPLVETFMSGTPVPLQRTNTWIPTRLFGPKNQTTNRGISPFLTLKRGITNFRLDPGSGAFSTFTSSLGDLRATNVSGVLYPGGGLEGSIGPVGPRREVGEEICFGSGAHHNLRVSFGPIIRF
jgi:hypothetical protein